ncbi:MAG TPA: AMP-binding protein [bacterium]|nr:AMP-binding protein [bacterium]
MPGNSTPAYYNAPLQTWDDAARRAHQAARFDAMAATLLERNAFYRAKWADLPAEHVNYAHLAELPFTRKRELLEDQAAHGPFGTNLTYPLGDYIRMHQTSGTTGTPLRVLDTRRAWDWWGECWRYVLDAAGVTRDDVVMLAFSFGPFIGFWSAQEAVGQMGALMLSGGGMTSAQRLHAMRELGATVLLCTPSYALHLAEEAEAEGIDLARDLKVRVTVHAGEPGAGIPATRERIETLWGVTAFDHPGASEVGAYGYSCATREGVHVNEAEFIAEVVDPATGAAVEPGQEGELVLTNLGRDCFPVVRYRTGDVVRARARGLCGCGRTTLLLEGGILGRSDDMVTVRGVNVFPSAFLEIFNRIPGVVEHRITAYRAEFLDQLHVEFECTDNRDRRAAVSQAIRDALGIRVSLHQCPPESLPRYELKAKRFFDRRTEDWQPGTAA